MPDLTKSAVTVLGLGAMGTALSEALLAAGHPLTVWNRSADKATPLVGKGATRAETPAEAVAENRFVIVCLLDYASVRDVLDTDIDALSGRVVVNLTNGTPEQARDLADRVGECGADYLDGGIMAIPPMIGTPGAFLLYSGSAGVYDTYRPLLEVFGESHYLGTDPGLAPLYDLALLSGMYGQITGILHAYALTGAAGLPAARLAPLLIRWLVGMSGFAETAAEHLDRGGHATGVGSPLGMQAVGYGNLLAVAESQGMSTELLAPLGDLLDKAVAHGRGAEDISALAELLTP